MKFEIRTMKESDWDEVAKIYLEGIATGQATFESSAPGWKAWDASHLRFGRLVADEPTRIFGWAALAPVSTRAVYSGVAEVSVYVAGAARGFGIGKALLTRLIQESELHEIWTLQAGIFPENEASMKLHMNMGFRIVGTRERIGKMQGIWRNTVLLERRSLVVGNS